MKISLLIELNIFYPFFDFLNTDAAAFIVSKVSLKFQLNETVDRLDKAACACSYCL